MKRLLIGYDFNSRCAHALSRALRLAAPDAQLLVVHAAERIVAIPDVASLQRRVLSEAQTLSEELGADRVHLSACAEAGRAEDVIQRLADDFDADLVVLGGHGEPRFRDAVFGTTATHLVRHLERPVLVAQGDAPHGYRSVMLAIDDPAKAQPLMTTTFAIAPGAEAFAVHAFEPTLIQSLAGEKEIESEMARLRHSIEGLVAGAARSGTGTRIDVHGLVEMGEALRVLMKHYETVQPDLLAIGRRSGATFLSSHAVDTIFWCPNDLLVVPEGARIMPSRGAAAAAPVRPLPAPAR